MKSIQARLGVGLGSSLVILFVIQWFVVTYTINHLTDEIFQTRLEHDAESLMAAVIVVDSGKISLPFASITDVYQRPFSGHYFRIDGPVNTIRSRSLWDEDLKTGGMNMKPGKVYMHYLDGPLDQPMLVYGIKIKKRGQVLTIHAAHDITDFQRDMVEFQVSYATISVAALLILMFLQTATIRQGLKPISDAQMQLAAMRRGETRKLDEDAPTEVQPLVLEINRLVELLSQRIERSRNALGNLAHALKAPLTVMNNTANGQIFKDQPELRSTLLEQTDYMRQLIERELKRARLAGVSEPGKYFNLSKDLTPMISMLESIYREKDLALDINLPENAVCSLDREDMMELFGNLLDNACKFAKNIVRFTAVHSNSLVVIVEDDGPGVEEAKINELLKRGVRIDESTLGHGLGLSIVKDTVTHYNGKLEMGRSVDLKGFKITITLPVNERSLKLADIKL
ncbi:MAG: ATP-binding protein [Gammaproteobacteria bacterium]|nr:ATP-binding protein [Gammaproteobacteria bacterium]